MSRRLKRIVRSSVTIGILASQLIGCGTMSQEPFQKLEKENVIETIQTVTEEEKEFSVEMTSEEKESEDVKLEEDTIVLEEVEQVEEDSTILVEVDKVEEDTDGLNETTGVEIIEEMNQKMYVISDSYAYDIDGVNGERNLFNAGYGLAVTGLTKNGWYRVESGGYIGYMWKENLSEDEYYSLGSRLAREESESEAMRLELERESEVIEQSTESEEQRIAREEAERQAAEQARLEAEEKARQEAEQLRLEAEAESRAAEQLAQNQAANPDIPEEDIWANGAFEGGIKYDNTDYGHTGEVRDMTDMSVEGGLRYNTDMSTWDD